MKLDVMIITLIFKILLRYMVYQVRFEVYDYAFINEGHIYKKHFYLLLLIYMR